MCSEVEQGLGDLELHVMHDIIVWANRVGAHKKYKTFHEAIDNYWKEVLNSQADTNQIDERSDPMLDLDIEYGEQPYV